MCLQTGGARHGNCDAVRSKFAVHLLLCCSPSLWCCITTWIRKMPISILRRSQMNEWFFQRGCVGQAEPLPPRLCAMKTPRKQQAVSPHGCGRLCQMRRVQRLGKPQASQMLCPEVLERMVSWQTPRLQVPAAAGGGLFRLVQCIFLTL